MKPIKRGYKLRVIVDMDGYISKFDVYQGRNSMPKDYNFPACFGLGESVVAHFTSDLFQKIIMSILTIIFHQFLWRNIWRPEMFLLVLLLDQIENSYLRNNLTTDKVMNGGDFAYRVSAQEIVYFKWMDNKPVHIISNFHDTGTYSETEEAKAWLSIRVPLPYSCERLQFLYGRDW